VREGNLVKGRILIIILSPLPPHPPPLQVAFPPLTPHPEATFPLPLQVALGRQLGGE